MDDFLLHIQQKQSEEIARDRKNAENVCNLIDGYFGELGGRPRPNRERLEQMERNITLFLELNRTRLLELNNPGDQPKKFHSTQLPASFGQMSYAQYCNWYKKLINKVIDKCESVMGVIHVQLKYLQPAPTVPATSPLPDTNEQDKETSVYAVAAMCYYLEEAGWITKFESRAKFIRNEVCPKYPSFKYNSINNKCSQMKKPEYRKRRKGAIKKAIVLMEATDAFNNTKAILLAKADCA